MRNEVNLTEILSKAPKNDTIVNNLIKAYNILCVKGYKKIMCSISGGSDSDIMLDIVTKFRDDVDFVWFDTGIEYKATKEHLNYLEERYGIEIKRVKAIKPIPVSCKEYGQPFVSKMVSEFIYRLQKHNFQWEDKPFDELYAEYPRCKSALNWWCNLHAPAQCISRNKYLKEFLIENPPQIRISNKCCDYAKKKPSENLILNGKYDLCIIGVRKSEGGERATAYKNCFDEKIGECSNYRPLFFYKDSDKEDYKKHYGIRYSRCYEEYGLKRTGCVGCPYGRKLQQELNVLEEYEPLLHKVACNVFSESYEYTKQYREFVAEHDKKEKSGGQITIDEWLSGLDEKE